MTIALVSGLALAALAVIATRFPLSSDALRSRAVAALADRLDADVELQGLTMRLFPRLRATGTGLRVWHRGHRDRPPLLAVSRLTIDADVVGVWRRRIARVSLEGLAISIPPRDRDGGQGDSKDDQERASTEPDSSYTRDLVIEELSADDGQLVILRREATKPPRTWQLHRLRLRDVGVTSRIPYDAVITNAVPPGEVVAAGSFGPWSRTAPGSTPLDGKFTFAKADLGVFKGISGVLASTGTFGGTLDRMAVDGETDTPDFMINLAGQTVPLHTRYHAVVDGTNGNTTLDPVEARVLDTAITARGGVYEVEGVKGREVRLDVTIDGGRLEDMMRLAVKSASPPMVGGLQLVTSLVIPPGDRDVVDKLQLDGRFAIERGSFTNRDVQLKINELSRRARGRRQDVRVAASAPVASNFSGGFRLADARLSLTALTFDVPGAVVQLDGSYSLRRETLAFAGNLHMDARLSQTVTGFKSLLMKAVDPLFRRNGRTVVPLKVSGTRNDPQFGLDVRRVFRR